MLGCKGLETKTGKEKGRTGGLRIVSVLETSLPRLLWSNFRFRMIHMLTKMEVS